MPPDTGSSCSQPATTVKEILMNALTFPRQRMDDMFPELFRRFMRPVAADFEGPGEIRVDLSETDKEYVVKAEVPGVKKEDIKVSIDGNRVSISAEVKKEKEEKGDNEKRSLYREIFYGSASREFTLAHEVDDKAAVAKYENGILNLTLPKRKEAASKTLRIQ
jgi:HSP20 family protein